MKQKVEIEVDVPDGWKPTGEFKFAVPYEGAEPAIIGRLLLEKVEPKRESRWLNVFCDNITDCPWVGTVFQTRDFSDSSARCTKSTRQGCIRIDYEDGKLVDVTLEPEGEP